MEGMARTLQQVLAPEILTSTNKTNTTTGRERKHKII
jgi:hypothetical protein